MNLVDKIIQESTLLNFKKCRFTSKTNVECLYKILGVESDCSQEDIKKAFYSRSLLYHPDKHQYVTQNEADLNLLRYKDVTAAYEILSNPSKRNLYDSSIYKITKPDIKSDDMFTKNRHDPRHRKMSSSIDPYASRLRDRMTRTDTQSFSKKHQATTQNIHIHQQEFTRESNKSKSEFKDDYTPDFEEMNSNYLLKFSVVILIGIIVGILSTQRQYSRKSSKIAEKKLDLNKID